MQLKRLEAYGFKSFADKITIDFDQGITAIVGPNGSGKSNITDAIRWVLGEQNVRNLRGTKAEDIIFTGSASRRALGVAECSLVFANDGTLPVDFREVVVTRRLYRSGESEFFINRGRCRLKDIYNLFADTGIGHDGMSIIGQNRIDAILNARPEERRGFFEETAGITKYRNRKRESLRKLTDTEQNLVRVQDIIGTLAEQLGPLKEHAEKTRIWQSLQGDYDRCRLGSLAHDYAQAEAKQKANDTELNEARDTAIAAGAAVQKAEAAKEAIAKAVTDIEQAMQAQAGKNEALRTDMEQAGRAMAALEERQKQGELRQKQLTATGNQQREEIAAAQQALKALEQQQQAQVQAQEEAAAALQTQKAKAHALGEAVRAQQQVYNAAVAAQNEQEQTLTQKRQELAVLDRDVENSSGGQAAQQEALAQAAQALAAQQAQAAKLTAALETQEQAVTAGLTRQQKAEQAFRAQQQQVQTAQQALRQNEQASAAARQQVEFLTRMQQSYEGFGKAARAVLQSKAAWRQGVGGAVAELIDVPAKYVTAIETALGGSLQDVVTEDTDTAKAAIAFLKQGHLGRVTFLPLSTLVVRKAPEQVQGAGVIGWGSTLVQCETHYRLAVDFLLARTLVVDTLDHGLALAKAHGYRLRMVTLEGELLNPGGSLSGGSSRRREASFISRQGELAGLKARLAQLEGVRQALQDAVTAAQAALATCEQERTESLQALQEASERRAELRAGSEAQAEAVKQAEARQNELQTQAEAQQADFVQIQQQRLTVFRAVGSLEIRCREAKQAATDAEAELTKREQAAEELAQTLQEQEVQQAVLEQQALRSREQVLLRQKALAKAEQQQQAQTEEAAQLATQMQMDREQLQALKADHTHKQQAYAVGRQASDQLYAQRADKLGEARAAEQHAREAAKRQNEAREQVHSLEIVATKLQLALQDKAEALLHDFGLTPERAAVEAPDLPPEELKSRMRTLKHKIDALGPVNPNALQEYEELSQRHDFLEKQAVDLQEARANLQRILDEMDAAMTKQFKAAFHDIQRYFQDIFRRLFGGGEAELRLLEPDNVLESGVDILVTLPEKKRQNLAALSGGERALTVIALLFAFLKYRPSPFAVLDEIDAPLDEANVVRFGQFLKEFAGRTQFIVVTHRKGTMEAVDTMYGVTIQDAGVSKILSVKLEDVQDVEKEQP